MKTAIYPGSFDPVTFGHIDIIRRISETFDRLVVAVMRNSEKSYLFEPEERAEMIRSSISGLKNVEVVAAEGLLADFAKQVGNAVLVKGLRAVSDFEYEFQLALINKKLNPALDTMFLTADDRYMFLSSSVVREVASYGGDISELVPEAVIRRMREKFPGI